MVYQSYTEWLTDLGKKISKVYEETIEEYYDFLEKKLKENYDRIIDQFYASYTPKMYKRSKDGGLKNLLRFERLDDGLKIDFDPSRISMRSGYNGEDGLYKTVFKLGYHGGSRRDGGFLVPYTNPNYEYDGSSSPWKEPEPWKRDKNVKHGWKPATRSVSPHRMWKSFINGYNSGQYQKDFNNIFEKRINKYL